MHKRNQCFGALKCFHFSIGNDKDVAQTERTVVSASLTSTTLDPDVKVPESASSHNISETSSFSLSKTISLAALAEKPNNLKEFTVAELRIATKNFSRSLMLGEGGFGSVYKGVIRRAEEPDKRVDIAVKQLSKRGSQGHKEWVTEVSVLGVVEHPNLVKLVGYCAEDDERGIQRLLVYEYMSNGSVFDHLSSRSNVPIPWKTRLRIAQDTARGLAYLHEGLDFQIIFRDFKSSNILLDDYWNAKLSDFGLARLGPSNGLSHVSTAFVGTIGYAAPEYINTGRLTSKSDVWSYGIFLYELVTGRRAYDKNRPKGEQKLLEWIKPHLIDLKKFKEVIDPRLEEQYCFKSIQKVAAVANRCLCRHAKARPMMSDVLKMLDCIVDKTEKDTPSEMGSSPSMEDDSRMSKRERLKKMLLGGEKNHFDLENRKSKVVITH
uniref:non-specific serine/threonine protein kinase n=1 Tax=Kalanchoe fedtschenkoi TaxID=63787 RepID=A0A7N0T6W1_KALFE